MSPALCGDINTLVTRVRGRSALDRAGVAQCLQFAESLSRGSLHLPVFNRFVCLACELLNRRKLNNSGVKGGGTAPIVWRIGDSLLSQPSVCLSEAHRC